MLAYPPISATPSIVWGVFDVFAIRAPFGGGLPGSGTDMAADAVHAASGRRRHDARRSRLHGRCIWGRPAAHASDSRVIVSRRRSLAACHAWSSELVATAPRWRNVHARSGADMACPSSIRSDDVVRDDPRVRGASPPRWRDDEVSVTLPAWDELIDVVPRRMRCGR